MFSRSTLCAFVSMPKVHSSLFALSTRSVSPNIRIGKELFQISVDVRHFNKDEIRVKAHPDYVVIEGKQEKDTQQGYILRQFVRKFKLPEGCAPQDIKCMLNNNGMLTVKAQRSYIDTSTPAEVKILPVWDDRSKYVKKEEFSNTTQPVTVTTILAELCRHFPKIKRKQMK